MLLQTKDFFAEIYEKRRLIYDLAKRNFQQQYMGSYLDFVWVFLQPLIFISVLYGVFTIGLRSGRSMEVPFVVYLITGMIAWNFFAEILNSMPGVIRSHSFLVNKVDFRLSVLPIVKILSVVIPHFVFVVIALAVCWYNGIAPSLYTLQVLYYLSAMIALLLGLGWMTSSTSLFVRDVANVVKIIVQFGFWLTPIFWDIKKIPAAYQWIIKLNPMYYIVSGYRDSLVFHVPFWTRPVETLYFWAVILIFLYLGITIFSKLRPHFAEVV